MSRQKLSVKPYRGTRDFFPEDMALRNWIFDRMRRVAESFGYQEYDGPMLERFELYAAKSGEELVREQLYHFKDRAGRHVAIRPEMTPTAARMVAARLQTLPRPIRWFSFPNLWRYEKPQRGRLREHWQFNVDILGTDAVYADLEIIEIAIEVMKTLGAPPGSFTIHISNRRMLNMFLNSILSLDEKASSLVCKAMDKKKKVPHDVFEAMLAEAGLSPSAVDAIHEYMNLDWNTLPVHPVYRSDGAGELQRLVEGLRKGDLLQYCILDLSIVRGLEYYTGTVFEMFDTSEENRRALFGGGRYDDLVGLFSNTRIPGVGFGMGDVTISDFMATHGLLPGAPPPAQVHVAVFSEAELDDALGLARRMRGFGFRTTVSLEPSRLGRQFKYADQMHIPIVALQGPDERAGGLVRLKHLPTGRQADVPENDLRRTIEAWLNRDRWDGGEHRSPAPVSDK